MLKIENLSKTYKRGKHSVHALKNVNFTLGDSGFVFITGKSGCGKSTMLNLIGGLDNRTSGDIICDGNRLSEFSIRDFDNYRNNYLGFVFQDFHLIEDLDVYQNIAMAIHLLGIKSTKEEEERFVREALRNVELGDEYTHRFVRELSGGQKQRVAIARALVKNPRLILADEPTGNLDSKTSKIILELLKKLSEDRLVIIVSHNLDDAKKYADRIIELADGEVISDVERVNNYTNRPSLIDGTLTLPYCIPLSQEQLGVINTSLAENKIQTIKQNSSGFIPTKAEITSSKKIDITSNHMRASKAIKLAGHFTRKRLPSCISVILITSLLVFILGICQFFIQFETAQAVGFAMVNTKEELIIAQQGYYDEEENNFNYSYMLPIESSVITELKDKSDSTDIYPIFNHTIPITGFSSDSAKTVSPRWNLHGFYIQETYGTIQCDTEYLKEQFGVDGDIKFLAGNIDQYPYGVIITDYVADSLIANASAYKGKTYQYLVDAKILQNRVTINGIIETDYKTKYADLIKYQQDIHFGIDRSSDEATMKELVKEFASDIFTRYGLSYTVNPHFSESIKDLNSSGITTIEQAKYNFSSGGYRKASPVYLYRENESCQLSENEVTLTLDQYNTFFGAVHGFYTKENYQTDFQPITFTLEKHAPNDESKILESVEVTIPRLLANNSTTINFFYASEEICQAFHNVEIHPYSVLITSNQNFSELYDTLSDNDFYVYSNTYQSLQTIGNIVGIFNDFFSLILIGLLTICSLLIISNSYRNIKKRFYEIGILKALGAKTRDVGFIFSLQTILTGIVVCIISSLALILGCAPINNTIVKALMEFLNNTNLSELSIIKFYPLTMLVNIGFIIIATSISCVVPLFKLHHIKPNVIMQKEKH